MASDRASVVREALIAATDAAIRTIRSARFYKTERGFHGRFYCALQRELDCGLLLPEDAILEMEYQKGARPHGTSQRPDIVLHIPTEHSHGDVRDNNFAVWALKRRASIASAREDFAKLDQMFQNLAYPLGFFLNIDAPDPMLEHYDGGHRSCLVAVATRLTGAEPILSWAPSSPGHTGI